MGDYTCVRFGGVAAAALALVCLGDRATAQPGALALEGVPDAREASSVHANGAVFPSPQPGAITLERIMNDPDWISDTPSAWHWAINSDAAHYRLRRPETDLTNQITHPLNGNATVVPDQRVHEVLDPGATGDSATSPDGSQRVLSNDGDLFLLDLNTAAVRQLTSSTDVESRPMFMRSGEAIAYVRGSDWFVRDLGTGDVRQLGDVRFTDPPKEDDEDELSFLEAQQLRYFETLSERRDRRAERERRNRELRAVDRSKPAGPFYIGAGLSRRGSWLSPSGEWMLVTARTRPGDAPRDVMPRYVTEDGYVDTVRVRPKVGLQKFTTDRVFLLNLQTGTHSEIDFGALPGISDAFTVQSADESDESQAVAEPASGTDTPDADDSRDDEPQETPHAEADGDLNEKEAAPSPRTVTVRSVGWSPDGGHVAVMLEAVDNKDRWLVALTPTASDTLDAESTNDTTAEPLAPVLIERLHDDAWINWRFNEMGWLRRGAAVDLENGPTLWFLSEQSGYSHLYTWSPGQAEPVAQTSGAFEISSVVESPRGGLYFLMNRDTPVEYEIGTLDPFEPDPVIQAVTDLGGTVGRFELSPDGSQVLFEWSSSITPPELYTVAADGSTAAERLTMTISDAYLAMPWVEPEIVPIPGSDHGRPIWTKVYRVPGSWSPEDGPRPGVMFVHGAGYTQNSDNQYPFYFREQMFHSMLAHEGYVVVDMDYRASSGYGRDWRTAIARHMGKPELEDLRDGVEWAVRTHGVDSERFGVYGGSYGGFMTLYAMFVDPQLFAAGAALRPVTDWAHYNHGYTSNILNTPQLDPVAFERSSPIELAEGLENPLLICHGMLDDNVVFQDTVRLAQRLIELEKADWEVAIYPMEPHGFIHPSAWLDEYRRIYKLFERHLRAGGQGSD